MDEQSVTIQLDYWRSNSWLDPSIGNLTGHGAATFSFDTRTGELVEGTGSRQSEEGLVELEAQIASGEPEYGKEAFILYRPQFGVVHYSSRSH